MDCAPLSPRWLRASWSESEYGDMGGTSEGGRGGFATGTSEVQSLRPAESGGNAPGRRRPRVFHERTGMSVQGLRREGRE